MLRRTLGALIILLAFSIARWHTAIEEGVAAWCRRPQIGKAPSRFSVSALLGRKRVADTNLPSKKTAGSSEPEGAPFSTAAPPPPSSRPRSDEAPSVRTHRRTSCAEDTRSGRAGSKKTLERLPHDYLTDPLGFLSRAPVDSLILLPGIGPVLADRLRCARSGTKPFTRWEDLLEIKGIGPRKMTRLKRLAEGEPH